MKSSYTENNFGELLHALVRVYKPMTCVELGCLEGYSSVHIAKALKENGSGTLTIIDLFEDYPFNSSDRTVLGENLAESQVAAYCTIVKGSAFEEAKRFADGSVDFLHVDISNDGERLSEMFDVWTAKLKKQAIVLLEGGSEERDQITWMRQYKKQPIREFFGSTTFAQNFEHFVFDPFPSITICKKR
mgnify:FL=1